MSDTSIYHHQSTKKHKKHKSEKRERFETNTPTNTGTLKLILKVGGGPTPTQPHGTGTSISGGALTTTTTQQTSHNIVGNHDLTGNQSEYDSTTDFSTNLDYQQSRHKKSKKKKKKKKSKEKKHANLSLTHRHHHHHHHHHKKRKKQDIYPTYTTNNTSNSQQSPTDGISCGITLTPQTSRELRTCVLRQRHERTPLQKLLEHLLGMLEKKDPKQFFQWPVTDNIAPGYSTIIKKPMDFSTMRQKIYDNFYENFEQFYDDFKLICQNAMKYNHIDTIYYKAGRKLLHNGTKMMQPEKLAIIQDLYPDVQETKSQPTPSIDDTLNQDENDIRIEPDDVILTKQPKSQTKMGYLQQKSDGSIYLNILVGTTDDKTNINKKLCPNLLDGTSYLLPTYREDRRNSVKTVKNLYWGAFGSYAPSYDSTFANLTKSETDLIRTTYGSDSAVEYAESLLDFVKNNDYAINLVDSLLDLLTGGEHRKLKSYLDEQKKLKNEENVIGLMLDCKDYDKIKINVNELKSLKDLGIDMDFLDKMSDTIKISEERHAMQQRLDGMSILLEQLHADQYKRLSTTTPTSVTNQNGQCQIVIPPPAPDDNELTIAERIGDRLTEMVRDVKPIDVVPLVGVRRAMGVSTTTSSTTTNQTHAMDVVDMETSVVIGAHDQKNGGDVPDLELELRHFLETTPQSPLRDDKTIEEILME